MQTFYGLEIRSMYVVTEFKKSQYDNVRFISKIHFNYNNGKTFAFLYDNDLVFNTEGEALNEIRNRLKTALKEVNKNIKDYDKRTIK